MIRQILKSNNEWTGFILRLTIGLILLPHGAQKALGWFGGYGFEGTMNFFTETMNLPWIIAVLVIVIEFIGSLFLIAGFATRIWATAVIVNMTGIIFSSHIQHGFFMNWFGNQAGEGIEYFLLVIGLASALLFTGSGKYSTDKLIIH